MVAGERSSVKLCARWLRICPCLCACARALARVCTNAGYFWLAYSNFTTLDSLLRIIASFALFAFASDILVIAHTLPFQSARQEEGQNEQLNS